MNQRWIASGSQEPLARVHEGEAAPAQTLRKHMTPDNFDNAGVDQLGGWTGERS